MAKKSKVLITPNDWSTLSNGTVGGAPTGLHRFVGEQRFVFALLNVTDGHGNLASYDLETRESSGRYTDRSGNGLHAVHFGDPPAVARFDLGARLEGHAGSYVFPPDDHTLDDVHEALACARAAGITCMSPLYVDGAVKAAEEWVC